MKYVLKEMSLDEKPRSKMKKFGSIALSDYELLAIILKTGIKDKSVIDLSIEILNYFTSLKCLEEATLTEIKSIKGMGEAKSLELLACIELGRRIYKSSDSMNIIKSAKDAYMYVQYDLKNLKKEHFMCIYLNSKGMVITKKIISIGASTETIADYKDAIKWALKFSSSAIIFVHNHPSGNAMPSSQDYKLTSIFKTITSSVDLKFVDHIIVGHNSYFSFIRNELINL